MRRTLTLVFFVVVASLGLGCSGKRAGSTESSAEAAALNEVYQAYKACIDSKHRPPASVNDLRGFGTVFPEGLRALKDGRVIVYWGVAIAGDAKGSRILGYEKKAPTEGGAVLLEDGSVKSMSAAEFQAAPKAGK